MGNPWPAPASKIYTSDWVMGPLLGYHAWCPGCQAGLWRLGSSGERSPVTALPGPRCFLLRNSRKIKHGGKSTIYRWFFPVKLSFVRHFPFFSSLITSQGSHRHRTALAVPPGIPWWNCGKFYSRSPSEPSGSGHRRSPRSFFFLRRSGKKRSEVSVRICLMAEGYPLVI